MKNIIQIVAVACLLAPLSLSAKDIWSSQDQISCKMVITPDFSVSLRGAGHFGSFLDQVEHIENFPVYDTSEGARILDPTPWEHWGDEITFDKSGFNGKLIALGFEAALTTIGKVKITGGGEFLLQSKPMDLLHRDSLLEIDSVASLRYFEVAPTGIITLSLPFSEGFVVSLVNRFERRMFRSPTNTKIPYPELEPVGHATSLRYAATVAINFPDLTPLRIAPLIYYEGLTQSGAKGHLVGWGYGFSLHPLKSFDITLADRIRWDPNLFGTTTHQLSAEAQFIFGCSGK